MNKSHGFSLIEMMVALTLSLMLLAGVVHFYTVQRSQHQLQLAMSESQQNAELAMQLLISTIQKAGFIGCRHVDQDSHIHNHLAETGVNLSLDTVIRAKQTHDGASLSLMFVDDIGDVISNMETKQALWLSPYPYLGKHSVLVISDCEHADVVKLDHWTKKADKQHVYFTPMIAARYHTYDTVGRLYREQFFVGPTSDRYPDGQVMWALQVRHLDGQRDVLVPGIRAMQLWFQGHHDQHWLSANEVQNWRDVAAVKIQLITEAFAPSITHASFATLYRQGFYYDRWHSQVSLNNH